MKSVGAYPAKAERQKRGLAETKLSGPAFRLVKLQRPPPEMRIFSPGVSRCSISTTRLPRCPATPAHIMPAAPAPTTATSKCCMCGIVTCPWRKKGPHPVRKRRLGNSLFGQELWHHHGQVVIRMFEPAIALLSVALWSINRHFRRFDGFRDSTLLGLVTESPEPDFTGAAIGRWGEYQLYEFVVTLRRRFKYDRPFPRDYRYAWPPTNYSSRQGWFASLAESARHPADVCAALISKQALQDNRRLRGTKQKGGPEAAFPTRARQAQFAFLRPAM